MEGAEVRSDSVRPLRVADSIPFSCSGSVYEVPLNPAQATSVRDALAKAIYNNLFEWIVDRVNISMKSKSSAANIIGVLDIYGFEIFDVSSARMPKEGPK